MPQFPTGRTEKCLTENSTVGMGLWWYSEVRSVTCSLRVWGKWVLLEIFITPKWGGGRWWARNELNWTWKWLALGELLGAINIHIHTGLGIQNSGRKYWTVHTLILSGQAWLRFCPCASWTLWISVISQGLLCNVGNVGCYSQPLPTSHPPGTPGNREKNAPDKNHRLLFPHLYCK